MHEAAVARRVEIVWHIVGQPWARAIGDMAELVERRDVRLHEGERRLIERAVDILPLAGLALDQDRHDGAECAVKTGDVIGQRHRNPRRRPRSVCRRLP